MLQVIKDAERNSTGVFIPISDWNSLTQKHSDLQQLIPTEAPVSKTRLSDLAGTLPRETAEEMLKYVEESRRE